MLYDILIVDEVLGDDNLPKLENSNGGEDKYLDMLNVHRLIASLLRDNLRVIWTTGEWEDLKELEVKDISAIRYIFLDLHLVGISGTDNYKIINGNLLSIFGELHNSIQSKQVTCFINSKFYKHYGEDGKRDLQNKLDAEFGEKYSIQVVEIKNALSEEQKNELLNNNLKIYAKSLIVNKAIEVEKCFDEKLSLTGTAREKLDFQSKFLVYQSQHLKKTAKDKNLKKEIQLLQQIRNKLAHTDGDLSTISDTETKKTFWRVVNEQDNNVDKVIKFEDFDALMKYITSIDKLCSFLQDIGKNNASQS